jgi:hypothetical protein
LFVCFFCFFVIAVSLFLPPPFQFLRLALYGIHELIMQQVPLAAHYFSDQGLHTLLGLTNSVQKTVQDKVGLGLGLGFGSGFGFCFGFGFGFGVGWVSLDIFLATSFSPFFLFSHVPGGPGDSADQPARAAGAEGPTGGRLHLTQQSE